MLEFLLPIMNPDKPKRINLTMANTLFGAMSGIRPVNWGLIIHEVVGRALPHIGRKPSLLFPFILHLYQHYDLLTAEEEDLLTITTDEVTYKLHPEVGEMETSSNPIVRHPLHPKALCLSTDKLPLLLLILLFFLIQKPNQAGRPRGKTWISLLGILWIIPSNGSRKG